MLKPGVNDFETLRRDLNHELQLLEEKLARCFTQDRDGNLDLKGRRIRRVGHTKELEDVPNRRELQLRSLYETPGGKHIARSAIVAPGGIRTTRRATEPDELVPLRQMQEITGGSGNAVLTTDIDQIVLGNKRFFGFALAQASILFANGANNNVTIGNAAGGFLIAFGPTAAFQVSGFRRSLTDLGGAPGQFFVLFNSTNFTLTLQSNTLSDPSNQLVLPAATASIRAKGCMIFVYSSFSSRWVAASFA